MKGFFFLLIFVFGGFLAFGQVSFDQLKKDIDKRMLSYDYNTTLALINKNRPNYTSQQKLELDVVKVKILVEFSLYEEALKLSQNLLDNPKLPENDQLKIHIQRELIFEIMGMDKEAWKEIGICENIFPKYPNLKPENYVLFLIRKSSLYRVTDQKNIAFKIAKEALDYAEKTKDSLNMSDVEYILGRGYSRFDQDAAEKHFKRALFLAKKYHRDISAYHGYNVLAEFYKDKAKYQIANIYADSALSSINNMKDFSYQSVFYLTKSDIMKSQKKLDSALYYYKLSAERANDFNAQQQLAKVNELELQYNNEKEKIEKTQLKKDIKNTQKLNTTLILLIVVLMVLFGGLFYFLLQISRNKRKIEQQKLKILEKNEALSTSLEEKQVLVQELNHRVKNNLSLILSLIDLQKSSSQITSINDLHKRIKSILIGHELYSYNINRNDQSSIDIRDYLDKIFDGHQQSAARELEFNIISDSILCKVDEALSIGLMMNELVTNSVKHAKTNPDILRIELKMFVKENNFLELEYKDNGSVFEMKNNNDSLGLIIIEGMIKQLHGSYHRERSVYTITFPHHE
ncbi:sensor histidine kinase [Soonwooa sp.]|uniref:sensor histidine kinase n=1 Tax=Soonwooa sp. TaxID=1938592 RepID=UPI002629511F|nr:sensor histidine kinase [Soonwooa sp.]